MTGPSRSQASLLEQWATLAAVLRPYDRRRAFVLDPTVRPTSCASPEAVGFLDRVRRMVAG